MKKKLIALLLLVLLVVVAACSHNETNTKTEADLGVSDLESDLNGLEEIDTSELDAAEESLDLSDL